MSKKMIKYPKTVILTIATHGSIEVDHKPKTSETKEIGYELIDMPTFVVPDGMTITKYSEVPPGTCNIMTSEKIAEYIEEVIKPQLIDRPITNIKSSINVYNYAKSIVREFPIYKREIVDELLNENRRAISRGETDKELRKFVHTYDNGYLLRQFKSGNVMLNKTYSRDNVDAHDTYDWQIQLLNVDGAPDLICEILGRSHYGDTEPVKLEQIVNYLKDREVSNIILLDFSCSNFINKNYNPELDEDDNNNPFDVVIPERDLRKLRNAMIRDGYFGGKRRFTRRKNQVYRKTKKQITIR
jgi:hypothetical protein